MIRPVIAGVAGVAVVMLATGWASPANMVASASGANDPVTGPGPDAPSHVVIPARAHTATAAAFDHGGAASLRHRDHAERKDGVCRRLRPGHRDPDPDRHRHRA
jgi:hypothetical protein